MNHGWWRLAPRVAAIIGLSAFATAATTAAATTATISATVATVTTAPTTTTPQAAPPKPAFREVTGSPFPAGPGPTAVAFSPDGRFLAVADYQLNAVSEYAVAATGRLHRVPGSPFPAGRGPVALVFSPSGATLLVADLRADALSVDRVSASGQLAPARRPYRLAGPPYDVTYSPNGRLIATADSTGDAFELITSRATGVPTRRHATQALSAGSDPTSIAFSPHGRLLAVAEHGAAAVAAYELSGPGPLPTPTPLSGSPAATAAPVDTVSFNREGTLVAASDYNAGQIDLLSASPGAITPAAQGAIQTGAGSGPDSAGFSPVTDRLAVALGIDDETALYQVNPAQTPSPLAGSPLHAGAGPTALAFNSQGTLLATANIYSNSVSVYASTDPPPAVVRLVTRRATVHDHRVAITLACAALVDHSPGHVCRGTLRLASSRGQRLGHARFVLAPGTATTLALRLPRGFSTRGAPAGEVVVVATVSAVGAHPAQRVVRLVG
jgi:6-phosphogluconolactonase (cycloisomerase 2 family)